MERSIFGIGLRELFILLLLIFTGLLPLALFYFISAEKSPNFDRALPEPLEQKTETVNPIFAVADFKSELDFM